MTTRKTLLAGFAIAIVALVAGVYSGLQRSPTAPQTVPSIEAGSIARLFASTLNDTNGAPQTFAQWQGKTLVVNFWATWCPPCREEMPAFSRLQSKYAANGVQFVGIALDSLESTQEFSKQNPMTYPLLIGGTEGTNLSRQLGNPRLAMPYTIVINPAGETVFRQLGGLSERELDTLLRQTAVR